MPLAFLVVIMIVLCLSYSYCTVIEFHQTEFKGIAQGRGLNCHTSAVTVVVIIIANTTVYVCKCLQ